MGIKGLLQWVKKEHPDVIKAFSKRWADPKFHGKRIAIDATLLTNRFHFASRGGPLEGYGEVIGWYNLISEMKAYGVIPVAIWDQRGVREWKSAEARRRLTIRAAHLARRNHEFTRSARVHLLREAISDFFHLPSEEQDAVRAHWQATKFTFVTTGRKDALDGDRIPAGGPLTPPESSGTEKIEREALEGLQGDQEEKLKDLQNGNRVLTAEENEQMKQKTTAEKIASSLTERDTISINRITSTIDTFSYLVQAYRGAYRPPLPSSKSKPSPSLPGLDPSQDLTPLEEELKHWTTANRQELGLDEWKKRVEKLDEKLEDLVPLENFTETRRQLDLTREEGEIINLVLSPPPPSDHYPTPPPSPPFQIASEPSPSSNALIRLRALIATLPSVLSIYQRALDIPSPADHLNCQHLLHLLRVPILHASIPFEAEGLASSLCLSGLADYVGTEDSDVLGYSAKLLRNVSSSRKPLEAVDGEEVRQAVGLEKDEWVDWMVLLGTDASNNIPKIGPVNSLRFVKEYHSIENILGAKPKLVDRLNMLHPEGAPKGVEEWMKGVDAGRKLFKELPPTPTVAEWEELWTGAGMVEETDDKVVQQWLEDKFGVKLVEMEDADLYKLEGNESEVGGEDESQNEDENETDVEKI
ncbi:5' flap endonuclease [Cryptococcus neoformans c45]|nr:5' flap endonuclease [Cryptococcus neoformans var. grubii c45]